MAMTEEELTEAFVREVREVHDGAYMAFEWWGFGGVGMGSLLALTEGPSALCEVWYPVATEEQARRAAREWVGSEARELSAQGLLDVPRDQFCALLEVVRVGVPG